MKNMNAHIDTILDSITITKIGKLLHGEEWVTPLSKDLNINRKTIQRYLKGDSIIKFEMYPEIISLLEKKNNQILTDLTESKEIIDLLNTKYKQQTIYTSKRDGFEIERAYLKELIDKNIKVKELDFNRCKHTYPKEYYGYGENRKEILSVDISFSGVEYDHASFDLVLNFKDGTKKKGISFEIHKCKVHAPQPINLKPVNDIPYAIRNAVLAGFACYLNKDLSDRVLLSGNMLHSVKHDRALTGLELHNVWYNDINMTFDGYSTWVKAENVGHGRSEVVKIKSE